MTRIENLTKTYNKKGDPVLNNLSLEIKGGEIFSLYGSNGSGKTTLLKNPLWLA